MLGSPSRAAPVPVKRDRLNKLRYRARIPGYCKGASVMIHFKTSGVWFFF